MHLNWTIDSSGDPLMLLHGFTGIGQDWQQTFGETPTGFRHLMPDLPGHCASPDYDQFSFRGAAD